MQVGNQRVALPDLVLAFAWLDQARAPMFEEICRQAEIVRVVPANVRRHRGELEFAALDQLAWMENGMTSRR